jgi:hypothetical protein
MPRRDVSIPVSLAVAAALLTPMPLAHASADLLLIRRPTEIAYVQVQEITDTELTFWREGAGDTTIDLADCVALVDDMSAARNTERGLLVLADGQRFPGEVISGAKSGADVLVWSHRTFKRMEVPLSLIRSVSFLSAEEPAPADATDVIITTNGDTLEGYVTSLGDPITMTLSGSSANKPFPLPLERIVSMSIVAPHRPLVGKRLWLADGTVVDVSHVRLGHDSLLRITLAGGFKAEAPPHLKMEDVRAVLFDADGATPLAKLSPSSVSGPKTRYTLPEPKATEAGAPIGMSPIEFSGPLMVRYALPFAPVEFVADALLPRSHRAWGDLVLVVMDDDREVIRERLNSDRPIAKLRTRLTGSELTIRIEEGAGGPLQDTVVLEHALLLNTR